MLRVRQHGKVMAEIPAMSLVLGGGAPVYIREAVEKKPDTKAAELAPDDSIDLKALTLQLLSRPNIASKAWVYDQYDSMVQTNTVTPVGQTDAAVIRIKGTKKGLAMKTDCNSRYVYLNPKAGGAIAVAECARNIACTGARPLAVTNCLNFGNPYKPEVYFQFKTAVEGMGDACRMFDTPVTGGNVSFYNETSLGGGRTAIYPTPTIGMVGLLDDMDHLVVSTFQEEGDAIVLLGDPELALDGSEYLVMQYGTPGTESPAVDLEHEKNLQELLVTLASKKLVRSAHDVSDGGIAVTLIEQSIMNHDNMLGFKVNLECSCKESAAIQKQFFSEAQGRVVISIDPDNAAAVIEEAERLNVPVRIIGKVVSEGASIAVNGRQVAEFSLDELVHAYEHALESSLHLEEL